MKPATQLLYKCMSSNRPSASLKAELCDLMHVLVRDVQPKKVTVDDIETPVIIYTDSPFENDVGIWGALVIDPITGFAMFLLVQSRVTWPDFVRECWTTNYM